MLRIARRLVTAFVALVVVVTVTFVAAEILPEDPARLIAGPQARAADVERVRRTLDLDAPVLTRYGRYVRRLARGPEAEGAKGRLFGLHLGTSLRYQRPVASLVAERWPRSLELASAGLWWEVLLAGLLAWNTARRPGRWSERVLLGGAVAAGTVPIFLVAVTLQYVFAYRLELLPIDGRGAGFFGELASLLLPSFCLGLYGCSTLARLLRTELRVLYTSDAVRAAVAKGAGPGRVFFRHVLRRLALPATAAIALDFGAFLGGALVVEAVFRWPGLASLLVTAALERDGPVLVGGALVLATFTIAAQVAADLVAPLLDPRIASHDRRAANAR